MNHFVGLVLLSLAVAGVFTLVNDEHTGGKMRYFLTLLAYMAVGSLLAAWLMYFLPW